MRLFVQMAELVSWFALSLAIPAGLLYPAALWMLSHTEISEQVLTEGYIWGIGLLFLPTLALISFVYRKSILKKTVGQTEPSS